jgi:hypothetical protein
MAYEIGFHPISYAIFPEKPELASTQHGDLFYSHEHGKRPFGEEASSKQEVK